MIQAEIETTSGHLLETIAFLAQRGNLDTDNRWLHAISEMSDTSLRDGSRMLNDLARAPSALVFHVAGMAACIGRRNDLVGRLLGDNISIEDQYSGTLVPAAMALGPEIVYPTRWPSKALHDFLTHFFETHTTTGVGATERAWERWTFLYHTACECLRLHGFPSGSPGTPYLAVADRGGGTASAIGRLVIKEIAQQGDSHGLFVGGAGFVGDSVGFQECAKEVDRQYGEQADRMDWQALPNGSGSIPTSRHYPGVR